MDAPAALVEQGKALAAAGRFDDAVARFRRALEAGPADADAHYHLGGALFRLGRAREAIGPLRAAVALDADHEAAVEALGFVLSEGGRHAELAEVFAELARARPGRMVNRLRLGEALVALGRFEEARASFEAAEAISPGAPEPLLGLGMAFLEQGRAEAALPSLRRAFELSIDRPEPRALLVRALRAAGRPNEALALIDRFARSSPGDAPSDRERGLLLDDLRHCEEAVACYDRALRIDPDHAETHQNRGASLIKLGRCAEAVAAFDEALRCQPGHFEAARDRALALLTLGDFARGLIEFEPALRHRDRAAPWRPEQLWTGQPLDGRTVLLHADQGLGDTIQFIRYAAFLKARGARSVVVACQPALVALLETCPGVDRVITRGDALPAFDFQSALTRLVCFFTRSPDEIPAPVPYLRANPGRTEHWRERLSALAGLKVGIAWQGNPKHVRDRDRSFPLALFERLADVAGVRLVSLQKGRGAEQLDEWKARNGRLKVFDAGAEADPAPDTMRDTPALMMNLDLVIVPDTALAHLAGALGVPVWLALSTGPDWRWFLDRDGSPWYPTARLFRQTKIDDWGPVFDRIAEALEDRVRQGAATVPDRPVAAARGPAPARSVFSNRPESALTGAGPRDILRHDDIGRPDRDGASATGRT